ncbi:MAG: hypothetical protein A2Y38_16655 [Spirochaetes bacterium GWB1_59_5]|nr:MAG: hypothetical protein A2Y38_16655 [Spirochaetes bacterium GWB1_59_5]
MARINYQLFDSIPRTHEGAPARRTTTEQELTRSLMACMLWEDTFYEGGVEIAERIRKLTLAVDPEFAATQATIARNVMKLRHAPLLVAASLAGGNPEQRRVVSLVLPAIIQRPDEMGEFLAIYYTLNKPDAPLAAAAKRGLAKAFTKFDAYQLAKYNREQDAFKLKDVMFLTHPKPTSIEQSRLWKQLIDGKLPSPETWENRLSRGDGKQAAWTELLIENKLGALALLRNLRNMQQAGVNEDLVRQAILKMNSAWVLPFRFLSAAKYAPVFEAELEQAMFRSLEGTVKLPGKTALLVDVSGSMDGRISGKSALTRRESAAAVAVMLREICQQVEIICFESQPHRIAPRRGFALVEQIMRITSGGTFTENAKQLADELGYDRIVIITDEQSHQALSNPKGQGYVINVAAYKNGIGYGKWTHIDGWSEAVVNYITAMEVEYAHLS